MRFSVDNVHLLSRLAVLVSLNTCNAAILNKDAPSFNKRTGNSTIPSVSSAGAGAEADVSSSSSSSSVKTKSTSSSKSASITPSATLFSSTATTDPTSTITSAPPWGNQSIPINTCSAVDSQFNTIWTPCHVFAGTVQLSYFPQNSGNVSYPSTYYDPTLSFTLTSPSVYMIVNTITGSNNCGPLGPTYSTKVIPMDLSDVYTIQPYADATATTNEGPPALLTLSDLENCPNYKDISTTGQILATHPVDNTYNRCNPRLVFPVELKRLGYPYWKHCGNAYFNFGIFDPPGAVPSADSLFVSTSAAAVVQTTESASPAPTPAQDQAASTSPAQDQATSTTPVQQEATPTSAATQQAASTAPANTDSGSGSNAGSPGVGDSATTNSAGGVFVQTSTQPTVVAVVGTNTISAVAGSSGVILPNGSTASVGSVATLTDASGSQAVVSVATSGVFVAGSDSSSTFYSNPTVVKQADAPKSTAIATIAGQVISAAPGDSTVIINGQAVTSGGQAVTLAGTNNVASIGSEGLVIQYPSGSVSTYAIPKSTPAVAAGVVTATVAGIAVTATAGASVLVIGSQTVTQGGAPITLANNDVVSLGVSSVVVQYPGGAVSTFYLSAAKTSSSSAKASLISSVSASTPSHGVANAIATVIGATTTGSSSQVAKASGSSNSSASIVAAPSQFTGSGERTSGSMLASLVSLLLGVAFWM